MIDLEARSRRQNLIFHGIDENQDENCNEKVRKFIKEQLKLNMENIKMKRAHRLGAPRRNDIGNKAFKPRPLIVCFEDFNQKEEIRKNRHMLRAPFGASDDLPLEIRKARQSLENKVQEYKNQGAKRVGFAYPCRLIVDGVVKETANPANFYVG